MNGSIPYARNEIHRAIGKYISENPDGNFDEAIKSDGRWEIIYELSGISAVLFGWYPFKRNAKVLQINAGFGNITGSLCGKCGSVTAVEADEYRAYYLKKRYKNISNLTVINSDYKSVAGNYDYIIYTDDEYSAFASYEEYLACVIALKKNLKPEGTLLFTTSNRFGIKYLCGEPAFDNGELFDGITENKRGKYRFGRTELITMLQFAGFEKVKLYYPLPDHLTPQLIYTDDYQPKSGLCERLRPYIKSKGSRIINETELFERLAENSSVAFLANSFIAECGRENANVIYSALSAERCQEKAFATNICTNERVYKIPLFVEGKTGLERLVLNTAELSKRDIPVLELAFSEGNVVMDRVYYPTLADYFRQLLHGEKCEFLKYTDKLYEYILMSSEQVSVDKNALQYLAPEENWGPILKKAYIEMIPVNCFYSGEDFLFFDQEFTQENYPAGYVMFRAIRDIYAFAPETEKLVSIQEIKDRYGLTSVWNYYASEEGRFQVELRQQKLYNRFFKWIKNDEKAMNRNRRTLAMCNEREKSYIKEEMFNAISGLKDKKIIVFGAGKMLEYYLEKYGKEYAPEFVVDNSVEKWGTEKFGFEIKSPDVLNALNLNHYRIVIASNAYMAIGEQLEKMGIDSSCYRVYQRKMDELLCGAITDTITDGKFNVGFVTGAFDLFHIGHLNVLKNSKSRCHYLIAGVLTDDIIINEKGKTPYIPFEERIEIVKQCKYVDRVVAIDRHNTDKIDAWRELRYGCLFSGSDHENQPYWVWLQKQLRCLGSDLEFFPYTQSTSSTMLQWAISENIKKGE